MFVFGYGSLVRLASTERTLGRAIPEGSFNYAKLNGWQPAWCVGSDGNSHPERTFRYSDGSPYDGLVVVLGIERSPNGDACDGLVFRVAESDLSLLDTRERNYERVDVTGAVAWATKPKNCTVYTYIPTSKARRRLSHAMETGRTIRIQRDYVERVRSGFSERCGNSDATPEPPFPVADLKVHIAPAPNDRLAIGTSNLSTTE